MSFLGMISLSGIAVNDSIVLLDTINRKRRNSERSLDDAIAEGALTRLRAVLLTSITTIGGLLPLAIGGGAFWAPFAYAMIFGLGASTVLTLVIQPAAYATLERLRRSPA
jgi:multidrug efflux pump subunit AcrB